MGKTYHFHADVGANGALDCGLINGHDASCARGVLTNANEDSCEKVTKNFPVGKPHKCTHSVPDDRLTPEHYLVTETDVWSELDEDEEEGEEARRRR